MKRAIGSVALTLAACNPTGPPPPPPPIVLPPLPVIQPISKCKDVFPEGVTRPIPTGKPIVLLLSTPTERRIMWLDRSCNKWYIGPYDPAHAPYFCWYRPDLGDRYYANWDQDMAVGTPPQACPADSSR